MGSDPVTDVNEASRAAPGTAAQAATGPRQAWMGLLSKAAPARLKALYDALDDRPGYAVVRPAETGLVMVRGRAGGNGSAFNMGEMTVTRCVVQVDTGDGQALIGHAYRAGRDKAAAEIGAVLDALLQSERYQDAIDAAVIRPLAEDQAARRDARARKVAATKVEFFTMVRGED